MDQLVYFFCNHWQLSVVFIGLILALFFLEKGNQVQQSFTISANDLAMLMNREKVTVVDIRETIPFHNGHILGAIHLHCNQNHDPVRVLHKYKDHHLVLVDDSGQQASSLASNVSRHGFHKVQSLLGGIAAWRQANLPLVQHRNKHHKDHQEKIS